MKIVETFWRVVTNYKPLVHSEARIGTKIAWVWLVFSGILIVWLLVGIPLLSIYYPQLLKYAEYTSNIIIALVGGASVVYTANETRKTFENSKNPREESPFPKS